MVFEKLKTQGRRIVYYGIGYLACVPTLTYYFYNHNGSIIYKKKYPCSYGLESFSLSLLMSFIWPIMIPSTLARIGDAKAGTS